MDLNDPDVLQALGAAGGGAGVLVASIGLMIRETFHASRKQIQAQREQIRELLERVGILEKRVDECEAAKRAAEDRADESEKREESALAMALEKQIELEKHGIVPPAIPRTGPAPVARPLTTPPEMPAMTEQRIAKMRREK